MISTAWRIAIVLVAVVGLLVADNAVVYFTVQANLFVAAYFGAAVVRSRRAEPLAPVLRGAVTTWSIVTGLTYHFLLQSGSGPLPGLTVGPPSAMLTNWSLFLLHYVTPAMVLLDWIFVGPRRRTRWRDSLLWLSYPVGYGVIMTARAIAFPDVTVRYPYPFLDPAGQGWAGVLVTVLWMAAAIEVIGLVVVALDRLPRRG